MGTLYLVATPIGNLEDISARALRILGQVALIAAEDTRQTRKLLNHYQIKQTLISYHEHNKLSRLDDVLEGLSKGDVALVSDAGTPVLNDPGYELVRAVIKAGYPVSPIPGPNAPIAALIASGLPADSFLYLGYLPRKTTERKSLLKQVETHSCTLIILESPHRLISALSDLHEVLGDRQVAVARELTKVHEEIFRGTISEAIVYFSKGIVRGEFTLVISGERQQPVWNETQVRQALLDALSDRVPPSEAASLVSLRSRWPRRDVYNLILLIQEELQKPRS